MFVNDGTRKYNTDGSHACERPNCENIVQYDDEPYCFTHSPDSGSMVIGYSYRENTFGK